MTEQPEDQADAEKVEAAPSPSNPEPAATDSDADAKSSAAAEPESPVPQTDEDDAALDQAGRERPRFLLAFPEHPELARLAAAFEAGNYALVRAEAETLAERTENPAVRDAALELRRRIEPDPLAKYLLALTGALLLFVAWFAYHH